MNIVEAFNKLKENPNIAIKSIYGGIYVMNKGVVYKKRNIEEVTDLSEDNEVWFFSIHQVLSDDWEVVE
jgi:hypothetical protein